MVKYRKQIFISSRSLNTSNPPLPFPARERALTLTSNVTCSACCSVAGDTDCDSINSEWEFYASTLFFICLCCCFTALCGFTEIRRKKKGISFAQAWSVPQAMPVLRTWPRGSSDSDMNHTDGESPWAVLSDNEDELKRYPVAGLVDDSGIAFGFASSMPQSLLSSVTTALGRSASPAPPLPQEPELTLWVSREHAGSSTSTNGGPVGAVEASTPEGSSSRSREPSRLGRGQQRAVVVGNDLEEPLMLDGTGPGRGEGQTGGANVPSAAEPDGRTET